MNVFRCPDTSKPTYPAKCKSECPQASKCLDYQKESHTGYFSKQRVEPKGIKTRGTRHFDGIPVLCPEGLTDEEFQAVCAVEVKLWAARQRAISSIDISIDGDELVVFTREKSPIKRVRRITGYLSVLDSFNDAKQVEAADRVSHLKNGGQA